LRRWLSFFGGNAGLADTAALNFVGRRFVPNPLRARVFVAVFRKIFPEPAAAIIAGFDLEIAEHLIIITRLELMDLVFALGQNSERWSLHAPNRRQLETAGAIVERGHRARAVDPDQPIAFGSTNRRLRERHHFLFATQIIER